jgi:hypothetical protein
MTEHWPEHGRRHSLRPRRHLKAEPMPVTKRLLTALVVAVAVDIIAPTAARAAGGTLAVGMNLTIDNHACSLGFFATDSVEDQLAVTAGHCANGVNEKVYDTFGDQIGEVVAWQPDAEDGRGKLTGSRGFTVIYTYKTFGIDAFFAGVGTAKVGDSVRLYGARTSGTDGTITKVSDSAGHPDLDLLTSDVVQLPGDSGGPWYSFGAPTLFGIASSGDEETGGGARGAQAQPLGSLEQEIKAVGRYGAGFSVYTKG